MPIERLVGEALVVDVRGVSVIGAAELGALALPPGVRRVLFLTDWSARWAEPTPAFPDTFTCVSADGAAWLIAHGMLVVGTDFISIEGTTDPTFPVHRALLGADVAIVEGLDLRDVSPGGYTLWCLPLKVHEGDGGPARVVLVAD